jgi:hypothetical protein
MKAQHGFFSPNEKRITMLGTGYAANFITDGTLQSAGATLTNKRIYFSGKAFHLDAKGKPIMTKKRKILNVRDVTGTGYELYEPIHYLISGAVGALGAVGAQVGEFLGMFGIATGLGIAAISIALYFIYRKTLMYIEYAGGNIAFDVRWFLDADLDNFVRNIHLVKDKMYNTAATEQEVISDTNEPVAEKIIPQTPPPPRKCKMCSTTMKDKICPACEWMCGRIWNGKEWIDAD